MDKNVILYFDNKVEGGKITYDKLSEEQINDIINYNANKTLPSQFVP